VVPSRWPVTVVFLGAKGRGPNCIRFGSWKRGDEVLRVSRVGRLPHGNCVVCSIANRRSTTTTTTTSTSKKKKKVTQRSKEAKNLVSPHTTPQLGYPPKWKCKKLRLPLNFGSGISWGSFSACGSEMRGGGTKFIFY